MMISIFVSTVLRLLFLLFFLVSCNPMTDATFPTQSFVLLDVSVQDKQCASCEEKSIIKASGMIIARSMSGGNYILSAGHACITNLQPSLSYPSAPEDLEIIYRGISNSNISKLTILDIDQKNDFCLLRSDKVLGPPLKIANKKPRHGARVFNLAAPFGTYDGTFTLTFEGFFSGEDNFGNALYTIPAKAGSSGSPILDSRNRVVGMIHSATVDMENISISASTATLRSYLRYQALIYGDMDLLIY